MVRTSARRRRCSSDIAAARPRKPWGLILLRFADTIASLIHRFDPCKRCQRKCARLETHARPRRASGCHPIAPCTASRWHRKTSRCRVASLVGTDLCKSCFVASSRVCLRWPAILPRDIRRSRRADRPSNRPGCPDSMVYYMYVIRACCGIV